MRSTGLRLLPVLFVYQAMTNGSRVRVTSEAIGSKAEESDSCIIIGLPTFAYLAHDRSINHDSIPRWCDAYLSAYQFATEVHMRCSNGVTCPQGSRPTRSSSGYSAPRRRT